MKPTPSPWMPECVGTTGAHDNPDDIYEVTNGYRRICEYASGADARLIAAAPDLLEALQEYQRLVAYLQRTTNPEEWATHGDWAKLQRGASAAIAKALEQS